jgi:Ala-tRNA(Pro) deacylase
MTIAITLQEYLDINGITYEVLPHSYTTSSMSTAEAAKVPGDKLAKSVILEDENGYLMAIVPATHHVLIGQLSNQLNRHLGLATEQEIEKLFADCDPGAIPPIGTAYGMEMIVDDSLLENPDVYFEAGDHLDVIHMRKEEFHKLTPNASHGRFSQHL